MATPQYVLEKIEDLRVGKQVIVGDDELDLIFEHDDDLSMKIASKPNPGRSGTRDTYIAWLTS
jgi:hypothetical protein